MCLQANQWSLEELELHLNHNDLSMSAESFSVEGLILGGAQFVDGALQLSDELRNQLPVCNISWRQRRARAAQLDSVSAVTSIPLYLNQERKSLVADVLVSIPISAHVSPAVWSQRGVAVVIQSVL